MSAVRRGPAMYMCHLTTTLTGQGFMVIPTHRGSCTVKVKSWFKVTQLEGAELGSRERFFLTLGNKLPIITLTCSSSILESFGAPWEASAAGAPFKGPG